MSDRSTTADVNALHDALLAALNAGMGTDLRLAQMLGNAAGGDPYGLENDKLVAALRLEIEEWPGLTRTRPMLRKLSDPPEPAHVDDWIDNSWRKPDPAEPHVRYAQWFLFCHRLKATAQMQFRAFFPATLFCTYEGERHRVTGASRLGDVWLTTNFAQEVGYGKRVDISNCSQWSPQPEFGGEFA